MSRGSIISKIQENRVKKGFGQGRGVDYQPMIQVHDNKVASEGWLTRRLGFKSGRRIHHTLSKGEYYYLLYLEWQDEVVDIREQYPLLPLERTIEIAKSIGVKHAHVDDTPVLMTTDFNITASGRFKTIDFIRTVKPKDQLTNRTLELFEVERLYFQEIGLDWGVTQTEWLPMTLIKNIKWFAYCKDLETRPGLDEEMIKIVQEPLYRAVVDDAGETSISKLGHRCDKQFNLELGSSLFIIQHLLANKFWYTDMEADIKNTKPLVLNWNKEYQAINYA